MKLVQIYQCLCDETRLRILHLLGRGDLCVCHIQAILGAPQVKVSKHLAYLRNRGLVTARRQANWMIYGLPLRRSGELSANLACLQDCAGENPVFQRDLARLSRTRRGISKDSPVCCPPARTPRRAAKAPVS